MKKWWQMGHPSFSDREEGSRQRVWIKRWRALRHLASCLVGPCAPGIPAGRASAETLSDHGVDGSCLDPLRKAIARAGARSLLLERQQVKHAFLTGQTPVREELEPAMAVR